MQPKRIYNVAVFIPRDCSLRVIKLNKSKLDEFLDDIEIAAERNATTSLVVADKLDEILLKIKPIKKCVTESDFTVIYHDEW